MKYLIDTQILIWAADFPQNLSKLAHQVLADPDNDLFLSLVSIWEMQIKGSKLGLSEDVETFVTKHTKALKLNLLPITLNHIFRLRDTTFY